jgi:hypothetical protein
MKAKMYRRIGRILAHFTTSIACRASGLLFMFSREEPPLARQAMLA